MARPPEITHKIMSAVKSRNTRPELALRRELWKRKMRYRINVKSLPGKPDIVFAKTKIAVFCDGDFWHGNNWAIRNYGSFEKELTRYSPYWIEKIKTNISRDQKNTEKLESDDWKVIRIWESDIKKDVRRCADRIQYEYLNILRESKNDSDWDEYL